MKTQLKTLIPLLFILLFTYAAFSKLLDIDRFRAQLYLQPFSHPVADILLYLLPALEILLAVLLCFERSGFVALIGSTVLMAIFTAYISLALLHYLGDIPCSCGGILNRISWTVHLAFNWAFILAGLTGIVLGLQDKKKTSTT
jgi:hypothetical protein